MRISSISYTRKLCFLLMARLYNFNLHVIKLFPKITCCSICYILYIYIYINAVTFAYTWERRIAIALLSLEGISEKLLNLQTNLEMGNSVAVNVWKVYLLF